MLDATSFSVMQRDHAWPSSSRHLAMRMIESEWIFRPQDKGPLVMGPQHLMHLSGQVRGVSAKVLGMSYQCTETNDTGLSVPGSSCQEIEMNLALRVKRLR